MTITETMLLSGCVMRMEHISYYLADVYIQCINQTYIFIVILRLHILLKKGEGQGHRYTIPPPLFLSWLPFLLQNDNVKQGGTRWDCFIILRDAWDYIDHIRSSRNWLIILVLYYANRLVPLLVQVYLFPSTSNSSSTATTSRWAVQPRADFL